MSSNSKPVAGGDDPREGLAGRVPVSRGSLGRPLGDRRRLPRVGSDGLGEVDLEVDVEAERSGERERAFEQRGCGAVVAARERATAGGGEPLGCTFGEDDVRLLELDLVARGLLEVVAEDLVQLDQIGAPLLEPVREALVQVGADGLRQGVVGGVADQEMTEAVGLLAGELRCVGADELLAHERDQPRRLRFAVRRAPGPRSDGIRGLRPSRARGRLVRPGRAGRGGPPEAPGSSVAR